MISKETFVTILEQVKKLEEYQNKLDEVFSLNEWPISDIALAIASIVAKDCGDYEDRWYNLLTVDYICYYEWGTNYEEGYLIEDVDNGKKFAPTSLEELYDVIQYWNNKSNKEEENNYNVS